GGAVGDEEDPGAVEDDPVRAVRLLALLHQLDGLGDGRAHGRVSLCLQPRGLEDARGLELRRDRDGTERHAGDLDALRRELVGHELVTEGLETLVELADGLSRHRPRDGEEEEARASWFGVEREIVRSEGSLLHSYTSRSGPGVGRTTEPELLAIDASYREFTPPLDVPAVRGEAPALARGRGVIAGERSVRS